MISINSYDLNTGGGYGRRGGHPVLGTTSGQTSVKHIADYNDEEDYDDDLDMYVDDVLKKRLNKRLDVGPSTVTDIGMRRGGRDAGSMTKNVGGYMQEAPTHTTTASKGLSPRMTYRTRTNTKGPSLGTQGSAKYIRSMPGRQDGTLDGWSHAPRPKTYEDDENIWSLSDIDPHNRAVKRQNRIRRFIFSLEEN